MLLTSVSSALLLRSIPMSSNFSPSTYSVITTAASEYSPR